MSEEAVQRVLARVVPSSEEVEAIRARHEADERADTWPAAKVIHTDRATLLRLLDAARAELAGLREAAGVITGRKWVELLYPELPDYKSVSIDITLGDLRRLAAVLAKDAPT
jgi:predicted DNA-binding protein (UPF0251 family)